MSEDGCQHGPTALGFGPGCSDCAAEALVTSDAEYLLAKRVERLRAEVNARLQEAEPTRDLGLDQPDCDGRCSDGRQVCTFWHGPRPEILDQKDTSASVGYAMAPLVERLAQASRDYQPNPNERERRKDEVRQRIYTDAAFCHAVDVAEQETQSLLDVRLHGRQREMLRWAAALALLKAESDRACPSPHGHVTSKTTGVCSWCGATP